MTRSTTRWRRVATVVPLALVSAAWTTHLAGTGPVLTGGTAVAPADTAPRTLPDGTRMPRAPIDYPASLSDPDEVTASDRRFATVAAAPSSSDIPPAALAAYQRAETVINAADPTCRLGWQLIAAIGRVESDHGRYGGAVLDAQGVAGPAIIGPVLDGRNGTAIIRDTDAGQFDGDPRFDRAVGPMQFIPSTWSVVGVDADSDSVRDPHDIDDAALAAAVYLCSGSDDLSATAGQRLAVHRYNHSNAYVDLVLSIMASYLEGDFTSGPESVLSARTGLIEPLVPVNPVLDDLGTASAAATPVLDQVVTGADLVEGISGGEGEAGEGADPLEPGGPAEPDTDPVEPTEPGEPTDPTEEPTEPGEEPSGEPTEEPTGDPVDPVEPGEEPIEQPTGDPADPVEPEPASLSPDDAVLYCGEVGLVDDPAVADDDYDVCLTTYTMPAPDPAAPEDPAAQPLRPEAKRD